MILRRIVAGWSEERGAIAPFAAIVMVTMIGVLALVTDFGLGFAERRDLQAATDAAALAAVSSQDALANNRVPDLQGIAESFLAYNGFEADDITSLALATGTYCADASMGSGARFRQQVALCPGEMRDASYAAPNAVRVETGITAPLLLSRVLAPGRDNYPISASATAARIDEAAFQAGTGIADLNGGIANALLSGLLGGSIQLTVGQYDGLLHTEVKALPFLDALATNLNLTVGTYDQLLQTEVGVGDVVQAAIDVLNQQRQVANVTAAALAGLVQLQGQLTGNPDVALGDLIDLGVWKRQPIGGPAADTALDAGLNLFQLLSFTAQIANGNHAVEIPRAVINVPLLLSVSLEATAIEPPQKPFFTYGPVGAEVHTAQVRLQLLIKVLDTGILGGGVRLPIYIEIAPGEATLTSIMCGVEPVRDARVEVSAFPGVASVYVGTVAPDVMRNFTRKPTVQKADIIDVSLLGVLQLLSLKGKAEIEIPERGEDIEPQLLTFYQPLSGQVAKHEPPTTEGIIGPVSGDGQRARAVSEDLVGGLGQSLYDGLDLELTLLLGLVKIDLKQGNCGGLLGLTCWGNGTQRTSLLSALAALLGAVDPLVDGLLQALGLQVGYIDVNVTGVRCGVPSLVN
jgi:uncharacterized membrane protein